MVQNVSGSVLGQGIHADDHCATVSRQGGLKDELRRSKALRIGEGMHLGVATRTCHAAVRPIELPGHRR